MSESFKLQVSILLEVYLKMCNYFNTFCKEQNRNDTFNIHIENSVVWVHYIHLAHMITQLQQSASRSIKPLISNYFIKLLMCNSPSNVKMNCFSCSFISVHSYFLFGCLF